MLGEGHCEEVLGSREVPAAWSIRSLLGMQGPGSWDCLGVPRGHRTAESQLPTSVFHFHLLVRGLASGS